MTKSNKLALAPGNYDTQAFINGKVLAPMQSIHYKGLKIEPQTTAKAVWLTSASDGTTDVYGGIAANLAMTNRSKARGFAEVDKVTHFKNLIQAMCCKAGNWDVYLSYHDLDDPTLGQLEVLSQGFDNDVRYSDGKGESIKAWSHRASASVTLLQEGFGTVYREMVNNNLEGTTGVLDIGGGTIGFSLFDAQGKRLSSDYRKGEGVVTLTQMILNQTDIKAEFPNATNPLLMQAIASPQLLMGERGQDIAPYLEIAKPLFVEQVKQDLQARYGDLILDCNQVLVTGGGAELLRCDLADNGFIRIVDKPQLADALGLNLFAQNS